VLNAADHRRAATGAGRLGDASMSPADIAWSPDRIDRESEGWLERLRSTGAEHQAALVELHGLLLRAARFEIARRRAASWQLRDGDGEDLAHQSADDAMVAILGKLDNFRGQSRFTTWAYKFALYEAGVKLRRRAWQGREIALDARAWPVISDDPGRGPDQRAEAMELLSILREAIAHQLSPHQREVLVAIAINGIPIDVLAERLNTTRGALYKTVHDARRRLRAELSARGVAIDTEGS
jgi:RNA polymerase sigma-70 factor (ECF subfamily)